MLDLLRFCLTILVEDAVVVSEVTGCHFAEPGELAVIDNVNTPDRYLRQR